MIDRTIPYFNFIMKCDKVNENGLTPLSKNFTFKYYQEGFEAYWALLETLIGDFEGFDEALSYFKSKYIAQIDELKKRCIFIFNQDNIPVASCMAWKNKKDEKTISSLHWLVVHPDYQGLGLGRAVLSKTLNIYQENLELPIYLHTQPWSYKAIKLYHSVGFYPLLEDSFESYQNEYEKAMNVLKGLYDEETYKTLMLSAK